MATLNETVHEGMDVLLRMKDAQRALVATVTNGQLVVQSIHSLQASELDPNSPVATVLAQVHKQAKPLLVLDAEQETLLASLPEERRQEMRSAVCVPVIGEGDNKLLGILYADSKARAGNFSYGDLNNLQATAQQLAPRLAEVLALPVSARKAVEPPTVTRNQLMVVAGLLAAALLWFVLGVLFSTRRETPPAPVVGLAQSGPPVVVASFLGMLANSDWEHIPRTLSERMNRRYPPARISQELGKWMAVPGNRNDLTYRRPRPGSGVAIGDEATVVVDTHEVHLMAGEEARNYWTFKLKKQGGSWKIDSMEAAPVSYRTHRPSNMYPAGTNPTGFQRIPVPMPESGGADSATPQPSGG